MRLPPVAAFCLLALVACEKQPDFIKVKVPQDSVHSVRMDPVLPPFTERAETLKLRASAFGKDKLYLGPPKKVKWSTADPGVAVVSLDGLVEIVSSGSTKIKAETVGYEKTLSAELPIVVVIVGKVEIVPPEELDEDDAIHMGDSVIFKAKVFDDRGNLIPQEMLDKSRQKIKWRTSDYAATIAINGELEGRSIGDTQVVLEVGDIHTRFVVKVKDWRKPKRKKRRRRK